MTHGITSLIKKLPSYAFDIKTNLNKLFTETNSYLSQEELYSVALTIGYALKHENILNNIRADAKLVLEESNATACKIAAVMMAMNNCFYNFKDMNENEEIKSADSGLEMSMLQNIDVNMKLFEMSCLAVSILNKCKYCINIHQKKLSKKNVNANAFLEIARIVSTLSAAVTAMNIEKLRSYDFVVREASVND